MSSKTKAVQGQKGSDSKSNVVDFTAVPPKGMVRAGNPDVDGWYDPSSYSVAYGRICGFIRFETAYGDRRATLIELANEVSAVVKNGDEEVSLGKGSVLAVGITSDLEELWNWDRGTAVWLKCKGKKKTKRGEMWKYDLSSEENPKHRQSSSTPISRDVTVPDESDSDKADDGIPF